MVKSVLSLPVCLQFRPVLYAQLRGALQRLALHRDAAIFGFMGKDKGSCHGLPHKPHSPLIIQGTLLLGSPVVLESRIQRQGEMGSILMPLHSRHPREKDIF